MTSLRDYATYEGDAVAGYAPGDYCCACFVCGQKYIGDKRSFHCRPCAVQRFEARALGPDEAAPTRPAETPARQSGMSE